MNEYNQVRQIVDSCRLALECPMGLITCTPKEEPAETNPGTAIRTSAREREIELYPSVNSTLFKRNSNNRIKAPVIAKIYILTPNCIPLVERSSLTSETLSVT